MSVALAVVIALAALAGPWRRDWLGPFGAVCLFTLAVLGLDVMTGSRLQLETPFGLSVLEAGRFYGIGNEALGIYGLSGLVGAAWLALLARRRYPSSRRPAVLAVAVVATFAVFASGWPGFGGKVGGTIAMVPCFLLLGLAVAGVRLNWRRVLLVAVSGLALFALFALINYFVPVTGKSDIGSFAGSSLHGHSGGLLLRKINSNIGSLSVNAFSPLSPHGGAADRADAVAARVVQAEDRAAGVCGRAADAPAHGRALADAGARLARRRLRRDRAGRGAAVRAAARHRDPRRRRVPDHQARYRETTVPVAGSSPVSRK